MTQQHPIFVVLAQRQGCHLQNATLHAVLNFCSVCAVRLEERRTSGASIAEIAASILAEWAYHLVNEAANVDD